MPGTDTEPELLKGKGVPENRDSRIPAWEMSSCMRAHTKKSYLLFSSTYGLGRAKPDQPAQKSPHHADDTVPIPPLTRVPPRTVRLEPFSSHPSSAGTEAMRTAGSSRLPPHTPSYQGPVGINRHLSQARRENKGGEVVLYEYTYSSTGAQMADIFDPMFCELLFQVLIVSANDMYLYSSIFSQFPVFGFLLETSSSLDLRSFAETRPQRIIPRFTMGS